MTTIKRKWHWIIGGGCILFFVFLLTYRVVFFERAEISYVPDDHVIVSGIFAYGDRETWMNIYQNGSKIGYAHRRFSKEEKGYRVVESVFMKITAMGAVQPLMIKTEGNLNFDMSLSSFDFVLRSSLFRFRAQGVVEGKKMILFTEMPGSEKKVVLSLREVPHLSSGILETAGIIEMKPGEKKILSVFDPSSMAQRPVAITMMGDEKITIMGQTQNARKVSVHFMGARQFAWIGENGEVLKEQGILGITLEQVTKAEALGTLKFDASMDLVEMASITSNVILEDPEALSTVKVRISNINGESFALHGGRQSFRNNVLTVEKEVIPERSFRESHITGGMEYLTSTPFIQADHWKIRKKVQEIVSPDDPVAIKATKLVSWVHKNVQKRPVVSVPNALETLNTLMGDCNEHAVLLAALARAAGIPAQIEAGLVYQRGRFYYHAWNVLYLGSWITADAVMGQMPADVTHLRFVRGEMEQQIDLMGIIGKVKLNVIEKSR